MHFYITSEHIIGDRYFKVCYRLYGTSEPLRLLFSANALEHLPCELITHRCILVMYE